MAFTLTDFVIESNRIEGIVGVSIEQLEAHERFLALKAITVADLESFVDAVEPGARLRIKPGMDVRVGNHVAPPGGPAVREDLAWLLTGIEKWSPHNAHLTYEIQHPFMDGNGRAGRVLWLWMMGGIEQAPLGFLHHWYYQSLEGSRRHG